MRFEGREKRIQRGGTDYERIYQNVSIFFFPRHVEEDEKVNQLALTMHGMSEQLVIAT